MPDPACHYCDRPAEAQCPTCGRLYCPEHGEDVCLRCMAPESATPSAMAYRGSIAALVIATLVTVFLIVRPPESKSTGDSLRPVSTTTPAVVATATPTRPGGAAAGTRTAPPASVTAAPTSATSPTASPTPAERTYTVKAGDTLSGIAATYNTTVQAILDANPGLTENLQIGQVIKLPPP